MAHSRKCDLTGESITQLEQNFGRGTRALKLGESGIDVNLTFYTGNTVGADLSGNGLVVALELALEAAKKLTEPKPELELVASAPEEVTAVSPQEPATAQVETEPPTEQP